MYKQCNCEHVSLEERREVYQRGRGDRISGEAKEDNKGSRLGRGILTFGSGFLCQLAILSAFWIQEAQGMIAGHTTYRYWWLCEC